MRPLLYVPKSDRLLGLHFVERPAVHRNLTRFVWW